jgi:RNA polymerase sigma factor (sigma-70 family)
MVEVVSSLILQLIRQAGEDPLVRDLPDRELLGRFQAQQDQAAFHALLCRHGPMVFDVCGGVLANEADAEDAFQAAFLILARKAGSIRKAASLGSWLHGVAYRTALKARAQSGARRKHEARVPIRQVSEPDDLSWREVRQVLHEELSQLPERYRAALVLCYLESATQEAAAADLGLAKSTLCERLERGRALLRTRLIRRGLGPTAGLAAVAAPTVALALAAAPASLVASTIQVGCWFAAGQALPAGAVSAQVVALAKGALRTMTATKLASVIVLVVAIGLVGLGASLAAKMGRETEPEASPAQNKEVTPAPQVAKGGRQAPDPPERLPIDQAIFHRIEQKESDKSSGVAGVIEGPPVLAKPPGEEMKALHYLLHKAVESGNQGNAEVHAGPKLNILAEGPMLCAPDRVAVQGLVRRPGLLELEVFYTRSDLAKARGYWHPMIQLPVDLPPGPYELAVTWRQVESLPDGKLRNQYFVHTFDFTVVRPAPSKPPAKDGPAPGAEQTKDRPWLPPGAVARFRLGSSVSSVVYFSDGKTLVAGGHVGTIRGERAAGSARVWDVATGKRLEQFEAHGVAHAAVSPDAKILAFAGTDDGQIFLWDIAGRKWLAQLSGRRGWNGNLPLAFSSDGKTLVAGGDPGLGIWDVAKATVVWRNTPDPDKVAISPDVWRYVPEREPVYKLAFSPDGRALAVSGVDRAPLRLMDVAIWKELPQFEGLALDVKVAAFSPDGKALARQREGRSISLCDLASGKELRRFRGHQAEVIALAFSSDGKALASGGADQRISLWEVATGKELGQLRGHQGAVTALSWRADGKSLASGSADGTVVIWNIADKIGSSRP